MMKQNKLSELKQIFEEWSLSSTYHCFPKIFYAKNICIKLIWALIFILFSCLTFSLVVKGILDYFEFDVVTKVRLISPKSINFPTVTICDANPLTSKDAENLIRKSLEIENEKIPDPTNIYSSNENGRRETNFLLDLAMNKVANLNDSIKRSMGFSLNQIESCRFDYKPCDFEWFFSYIYGNCFQFNNGENKPIKETILGGHNFGLFLTLGPLINQNSFSTYYSKGLKVFIHNGSFKTTEPEEIYVKTGEQTGIKLRKTFTRKAVHPHSSCQDITQLNSNILNIMKQFKGEYRQKNCFKICFQMLITTECGCMLNILPEFENHLPCVNSSEKNCQNRIFLDKKYMYEKCKDECPLECEYTTYDWSMSALDYPSEPFFNSIRKSFKKNFSLIEYKETHLMMNIYFESVEYTEIVETEKTSFIDLIANLGGVLGIFLGFSIFSFVELFEFILRVCFLNSNSK